MCDIPMRVDETIALAAVMQALVAKIHKLKKSNIQFIPYGRALINENKWRAARWGISGKLIDFGIEKEVETKLLVLELLEFIDDVVDDLGSRHEIEYVHTMLKNGTGADRQLEIYEKNNDLKDVVYYIVSETNSGL